MGAPRAPRRPHLVRLKHKCREGALQKQLVSLFTCRFLALPCPPPPQPIEQKRPRSLCFTHMPQRYWEVPQRRRMNGLV